MTDQNRTSEYMEALGARDAVLNELDRMAGIFDSIARGLANRDLSLPNSDLRTSGLGRTGNSVDWRLWPENEIVKQRLQAFYDAQEKAENLYRSIPATERTYVQSPELGSRGPGTGGVVRRVSVR